MALKRRVDKGSGELFAFTEIGQTLKGYYLGSMDYAGNYAPTKKHLFKTNTGIKTVLGQTHLIQLLEPSDIGAWVVITYDSDKKMKKGNPMKYYTLDIDPDNKLDSDEVAGGVDAASGDDEPDYSDDENDNVVTSSVSRRAPAVKQAEVQALLRKRS